MNLRPAVDLAKRVFQVRLVDVVTREITRQTQPGFSNFWPIGGRALWYLRLVAPPSVFTFNLQPPASSPRDRERFSTIVNTLPQTPPKCSRSRGSVFTLPWIRCSLSPWKPVRDRGIRVSVLPETGRSI
jgi:hypothetical protein